jgi:DNA-binding GntR family transcriptional regulator
MEDRLEQQTSAWAERDLRRFVSLDRAFHFALYEASSYPQCLSIVERLWHHSERYVRFYATTKSGAENSLSEHRQILDAARAHRGDLARKLTADHVERGFLVMSRLITE